MKYKFEPKPVLGDKRIKEGFLFFPKIINNELRWLETAKWEQEFKNVIVSRADNIDYYTRTWVNNKWINYYEKI